MLETSWLSCEVVACQPRVTICRVRPSSVVIGCRSTTVGFGHRDWQRWLSDAETLVYRSLGNRGADCLSHNMYQACSWSKIVTFLEDCRYARHHMMIAPIEPQLTPKSSKLQSILDDVLAMYTRDDADSLKGAAFVAVNQKGMYLRNRLM